MKKLFFYSVSLLLVLISTSAFATETPINVIAVNQNGSYKIIGVQSNSLRQGYTSFVNAKLFANEEYVVLMVQNRRDKNETDVFIKSTSSTLWTSIGTVCDSFTNVYVEKITAGGWKLVLSSPICRHAYEKKLQPFQEDFIEVK